MAGFRRGVGLVLAAHVSGGHGPPVGLLRRRPFLKQYCDDRPGPAQPEFDVLMKPNIDMRRVLSDARDCRNALGASEFQAICRPLLFLNT